MGDAGAVESFLAVRDPSADPGAHLEAAEAFADGVVDHAESQQVLFSALQAQGSPVSLEVMPDSTHTYLSDAGWEVFLAAFTKKVAHD